MDRSTTTTLSATLPLPRLRLTRNNRSTGLTQITSELVGTSPPSSNSASTPRQSASPAIMFQSTTRASPTGTSNADRLRALTERINSRAGSSSARLSPMNLGHDFDSETETAPEAGPSTARVPLESSEADSDVESMVNHSMTRTQPQTAQERFKEFYRRTMATSNHIPLNDGSSGAPSSTASRPRRASLESPVAKRVAPRRLSVSDEEDGLPGMVFVVRKLDSLNVGL